MDKRTLLALLLILAVFWISSEFIWKKNIPQPASQSQVTPPQSLPQTTEPETSTPSAIVPLEIMNDDAEINDDIILQNDFITLRFSNMGAVLLSAELHEFTLKDKNILVNLIPQDQSILGMKLEIDSGNTINLENVPFDYQFIDEKVVFTAQTQSGTILKSFELTANYELAMRFSIDASNSVDAYLISFDSGIADSEEFLKMKRTDYQIMSQVDNVINKFPLAKLKNSRVMNGQIDWAAIKSKYFTMAIIPDDLISIDRLEAYSNNDTPAFNLNVETRRKNLDHEYRIYLGPLDYKSLKAYGNGIEGIVDMGYKWLEWTQLPHIFKWFLSFLYKFIPSWGICVIVFAVVLKVLLYPLTHKSYESTTKMQKINPLIKEIQTKYKSDPQTMQQELKKAYKENGVSPLGGCLPMLLQMPVIFALYPILRYSINLRQASFLWMPDLSEPDPIWLLPILMAVFMFVQQKLTMPSQQKVAEMDEKQQAAMQSQKMMMYIMPVMMFFIFKGLSSGLVLYWTVFSIIGSIQQYFIKKKFN
ncbi:MAG TPA: membrane protein insertase YidC [Candidatus Cloacimonadota bacterium]|nr:membrane protein insertase YidC [Candidatus Cloacimonadota bacterium]